MKRSDLVEFIEKTYRSWYHSTSTPVFEVLADALIREGYCKVDEPREFWIIKYEDSMAVELNKVVSVKDSLGEEAEIIHVREVEND